MSADELKVLPKGTFIVMKTGYHPMKVKLKLYFKWGITFGEPYSVEEHGNRAVGYADKNELIDMIMQKYHAEKNSEEVDGDNDGRTIPQNAFNIGQIKKSEPRSHIKLRTEKSQMISEVQSGTT